MSITIQNSTFIHSKLLYILHVQKGYPVNLFVSNKKIRVILSASECALWVSLYNDNYF